MDHETPELIERQMADTRESLTEKVSMLENQVVGKIQSATEAVQETVQSVRSAVEGTVATVTGTVRSSVQSLSEAFDMRKRVRETPWLMVGGATAAGFVTGMVVFRRSRPAAAELPAYTPMPAAASSFREESPRRPKWVNDLLELAGREVKKLGEQAIATASASVRDVVATAIPTLMERAMPYLAPRERSADLEGETDPLHHGNGRACYSDVRS